MPRQTPATDSLEILTRYHSKITTPDGQTLYLRALSDDQATLVERYALRESYLVRKAIKTEGSDEYLAHLGFLDDASDDELREVISLQTEMVAWVRAYRAAPAPPLTPPPTEEPPPSDDPLEERERLAMEHEEAETSAADAAATERRRIVDGILAETTARLAATVRPLLHEEARKLIVQAQANNRYSAAFSHATVIFATYKDAQYQERAFALGDWLPSDLQARLEDKYAEVGRVSTAFLTSVR